MLRAALLLPLLCASPVLAAAKVPVTSRPLALRFDVSPQTTIPMFAAGDDPLPIYLNRWETTYSYGDDDSAANRSSIVSGSSATIGAFPGDDQDWGEVVDCVRDLFSPFHVAVTDLEPTGGAYVEAMIGGSPDQLDMPWGVGGVAPYDPYGCNVISSAVVYAFADVYQGGWGWTRAVCETAAQEIAHAFALDHELLESDPMTYLDYDGERAFQNEAAACGEWEPRECSCSGSNQNSYQMLVEQVGAADGTEVPPDVDDLEDPTVTIVSPDEGDAFEAGTTIEIVASADDDVGIVLAELVWDFSGEAMMCPGAGGSWSCERAGGTYTWNIAVGSGARSFSVRVRDVGGNTVETAKRTIWLSEDGAPMPDDHAPPEVAIVSPRDGSMLPASTTMEVVVMAADDSGLSKVELLWHTLDQAFPCPVESDTVNCTVNGSTYVWTVQVGEGDRAISARAVDLVGNVVETETVEFTLDADARLPEDDAYEANDTYDLATRVQCGQVLDLVAGDDDWFQVDPPDGMQVKIQATGDASSDLTLDARTSPLADTVIAEGDGEVAFVAEDGIDDVRVRVQAADSASGDYRIVVTCVPAPLDPTTPDVPAAAAFCACAQPATGRPLAAAALLVGGIALLRRRRR
jgi:hypothetical protein